MEKGSAYAPKATASAARSGLRVGRAELHFDERLQSDRWPDAANPVKARLVSMRCPKPAFGRLLSTIGGAIRSPAAVPAARIDSENGVPQIGLLLDGAFTVADPTRKSRSNVVN
jgi:hypothetical protein